MVNKLNDLLHTHLGSAITAARYRANEEQVPFHVAETELPDFPYVVTSIAKHFDTLTLIYTAKPKQE